MNDRRRRRRLTSVVPALLLAAACSQPVSGSPVAGDAAPDPELPGSAGPAEPGDATDAGDLAVLAGTWTGEYTCLQGETGLTMTILPIDDASVRVLFRFYPIPGNPGAEQGSYELAGAYDGDRLLFKQQRWIDKPPDYVMVDFEVTSPVEPDVDVLSGDVLSEGCEDFTARRE